MTKDAKKKKVYSKGAPTIYENASPVIYAATTHMRGQQMGRVGELVENALILANNQLQMEGQRKAQFYSDRVWVMGRYKEGEEKG